MEYKPSPLDKIIGEREFQDQKWGVQDHTDERWLVILAEEFGEIARGMFEDDDDNVEDEIVQTAAVCLAWLESRARRGTS